MSCSPLFVALLFLLAGALVLLDTAPGHRFIVDRIGRLETASGLRIRIGRIDGSIFGKSQLKNVAVSDQRGVFLTSPKIKLDWAPAPGFDNTLAIDSLTAERVTLIRAAEAQAQHEEGTDPSRLRHPHRRTPHRPARDRATGRRTRRAAAACAARPTSVAAGRWSSLPR